jgi:excinuclease ABC subunit C
VSIEEDFLKNLPTSPGVYLMADRRDRILYVGKASNLRNRVRSYFVKGGDDRPRIRYLVERVHSIRTILTHTEKEALILENNLIKEHRPKYNVNLRDDKSFFSLRLNMSHPFPRLTLVRTQKVKPDGERYFGPYSSARDARLTLKLIQKLFPLRQCTDRQLATCTRPCLNCQMKRCLCPCTGKITPDEYARMVKGAILLLQRKSEELVNNLKTEMYEASHHLRFEEAGRIRDRLSAVERTLEAQNVSFFHRKDQDVIAIINPAPDLFVVEILSFRQGNLLSEDSFIIRNPALEEEEVLSSAIKQYYDSGSYVPMEVLLSGPVDQSPLIEGWLSEIRGHKVSIRVPMRGQGSNLMSLALKNAHNVFLRERHKDTLKEALAAVAVTLKLPCPPGTIEGYDISNTSGSRSVGVKVCFRDGKPDKSAYRKYLMKGFSDQDDPGMIHQTVYRRLAHINEEPVPDLMLIDGGKAQLNAALEAIKQNLAGGLPAVAAMAKARAEGETERFYLPNRKNPVVFKRGNSGLMLLMRVRDEAHRFAHSFHSKLRRDAARGSILDEVPGIGPKKRQILLTAFGSLKQLLAAGDENIAGVPGISKKDVERIRYHFNDKQNQVVR